MLKYCALFLCLAATAADLKTGQAARLVVGQETFTALAPGASERLLGGVGGLAYANGDLFVVDSNRTGAIPQNNRVLIFRRINSQFPPLRESYALDGQCPVCGGVADTVLGQPDFFKTTIAISRTGMRLPTAVATDGRVLAVADTSNNRVLIWNSIPTSNGAPADVVVGQSAFDRIKQPIPLDNKSFRGPQGVWIQGGRLFVADTQNHRVLIWNSIPSQNDQPADLVIGQPNFTTAFEPVPSLTGVTSAQADRLLDPVSVTSDGTRLYVTDLGHNRVLIWNRIPTQNGAPADVVVGQKDFTSAGPNPSRDFCASNGTNDKNEPTFPGRCGKTLDFPRYALSDGRRLFIADGGNDRVLVFNSIPQANGASADIVLGQPDEFTNAVSDFSDFFTASPPQGRPDRLRTPMSLAWDGTNLFVSDPFQRRVVAFSIADDELPGGIVRNAASLQTYAAGSISFSGTPKTDDEVTIKVNDTEYKYKLVANDTLAKVIQQFATLINAGSGNPNVLAIPNTIVNALQFSSKIPGEDGNQTKLTASTSSGAGIILQVNTPSLTGGQAQRPLAPGAVVSIFGERLSDQTISLPATAPEWPRSLGGVELYLNGVRAPLQFVSPTQINAQIPFEFSNVTSVSAYIRAVRRDGQVTVTNAINVDVGTGSPGIFAGGGLDPRPARAVHGSSFAATIASVDGLPVTGNEAILRIEGREYKYTAVDKDTTTIIRDKLAAAINANPEERVVAIPSTQFSRILLRAKIPGPDGNEIRVEGAASANAGVAVSVTSPQLCCANKEGAPITEENPAVPGEVIVVYATGLGTVTPADNVVTGVNYTGAPNSARETVSSLIGGNTATVFSAGLLRGAIGIYEVILQLSNSLDTNPLTPLTISQNFNVSNSVTIAIRKADPPLVP